MTDVPRSPIESSGLLPRDKFDLAAVHRASEMGYPAVAPILGQLLDWTADGNWPVARPLADFLITIGTPIVAPLREILRGSDSSQKEHCLRLVVNRLPLDVLAELEGELGRLVDQPTEADRQEGVDEAARDALGRLDCGSRHGRATDR